MSDSKKLGRKKPRVTMEELTKIRRLFREGVPATKIAEETGLHRHTVRTYLKENFEAVIADEARKQSLMDGLRNHYKDISKFALNDLRVRLTASAPESQKKVVRDQGSISTDGIIGPPGSGTPEYMAEDWIRMYYLSSRDKHLMKSLRVHTKDYNLWVHWDRFRKIVAAYEDSSRELFRWLEERIENEPRERYHPLDKASLRNLVFGNILRLTSGDEAMGPDVVTQDAPGDGIFPVVKSKDSSLSKLLTDIIDEAREQTRWSVLESATTELTSIDGQRELRRLVREIDEALVAIELTHAFPGRCELCPV